MRCGDLEEEGKSRCHSHHWSREHGQVGLREGEGGRETSTICIPTRAHPSSPLGMGAVPLARATACFIISRRTPPRGVVRAATPRRSREEEEEEERAGLAG